MKRARVTTRSEPDSEAARACARVSPVSPDALLALLDDADVMVGQLFVDISALASLTAGMTTRKDASVKLAGGDVRAARAALFHSTKLVAYCARHRARSTTKRAGADEELLSVTSKQLRVWGSPALARECVLEGVAVGCALTAVHPLVQVPTVCAAGLFTVEPSLGFSRFGRVVMGDGLRVVSAAGPGLKWFDPHSRNKFSIVLAHADGSAPLWLTTADVSVSLSAADSPVFVTAVSSIITVTVGGDGSVSIVYGSLCDDVPEVVLHLTVCEVAVSACTEYGEWAVRVPPRPLAGHECAAVGTHVRTLTVVQALQGYSPGIAVSADEKWLVVGWGDLGTLTVHRLPEGELVRSFGCIGNGPLQFSGLRRVCFANGDLIVVESYNKRLQVVTLEGVFVRFIGVGEFGDGYPYCAAMHADVIAVGYNGGSSPRVVLLDYCSGAMTSRFGEAGAASGQLSATCTGIRFTTDGFHVLVVEYHARRVSVFTVAGVFVRCVGVGALGGGLNDVVQSVTGEYVVADMYNSRVCVFSPDGSELARSWAVRGTGEGCDEAFPAALAAAGCYLYVMDQRNGRVQVYE